MRGVVICGGRSLGRRIAFILACQSMEHLGIALAESTERMREARKKIEMYVDEARYIVTESVAKPYTFDLPRPFMHVPRCIGKTRRGHARKFVVSNCHRTVIR